MDYFQNVYAKNLLTSFPKLKKLVFNGIKHFNLKSNHNKSFLWYLKTQNFFKNQLSNLIFDFCKMLNAFIKFWEEKDNV